MLNINKVRIGLAALTIAFATVVAAAQSPMRGVVRVKMQPEVAARLHSTPQAQLQVRPGAEALKVGIAPLDGTLSRIGGMSIRPVFPCSPERAAEHARFGLDQWFEITFDSQIDSREAHRVLIETPGVTQASTRVPMRLHDDGEFVVAPEPTRAPQAMAPFNDPRLPLQWHYTNDGSMAGSRAGADINLFKAWQITTGSDKVVVAVIDGGVDYTHEDLAAHMWVNQAELNGTPGVDDDGNGYIDDIYGYNFCTNEGTIYPHDHGTHVAGTVGAINNNGIGVAGVAGGDGTPGTGVRMMSCQVFDSRSGSPDGDFAAAIVYAADQGATIAQCSWGWEFDGYYEPDVLDAVRYFTHAARSNNMTGGLCIFSAGNTGDTGEYYPACMPEVISVAAMCYDLTPANYSTFADWVDVVAPGGQLDFDSSQGILSTLPGNKYGYQNGTSMASPHVSGIAALVLSRYGSPTLINESVRQQILTSVNDFYTINPLAEGLFGSGYVDAWKALQWGDGTAPDPVIDLTAQVGQDFVDLEWTIPSASDGNVNSHILYYSTQPFDAQNLQSCRTIVIDTKFNSSGDRFSYEITGLEPLTDYYIAIAAVDRWSNSSPLSELLHIRTTNGPKMTLNRSSMTLSTTDGGEHWTASQFIIGNSDEGLLKWRASLHTTMSTIRPYSVDVPMQPMRGTVTGQTADAPRETLADVGDFVQDDYPQSIQTFNSLLAFIGDKDTTNSMAQLYRVDPDEFPDGFNLTHVYLYGAYGVAPTIEVYAGGTGTLQHSNLLCTTKVLDDATVYYKDIQLSESCFFAPGESFYIAVHFDQFENRNYPLGLGFSDPESPTAQNALMSFDMGRTWTRLAECLVGSSYESYAGEVTWAMVAKSHYPDWSRVITLDPASGQVAYQDRQTVRVSENGTPLPNGTYRAKVHFDTNENEPNDLFVNVTLSVSGQKPDVAYNRVVSFGNLLVGQSKTIAIEVFNRGYGAFAGSATSAGVYSSNISSTCDQFIGPKALPDGLPARSTTVLELTYAPTREGSHAGVIVLTDKDGYELRINVQGAATEPARLVADPQVIEVGELELGAEPRDVTFEISNAGNYPLQFVMPKFTDETLDEVIGGKMHRFGYTWQSNLYGSTDVTYDGEPQLLSPTDVSGQFSDYDYFSDPIDIGFEFPFYGRNYEKVYISSLGILTFGSYDEGYIFSPVSENTDYYLGGLGVIAAYGFQFETGPNTRVEYARQDGKFVVWFHDVLTTVYSTELTNVSYHIALSPNGDIDIAFDNYDPSKVFEQGHLLWVGIADPDMIDPLTITSANHTTQAYYYDDTSEENNRWRHIATGTAFHIQAPQPDMITAIEPAFGMLSPGEKATIKATVQANDDMVGGRNLTRLVIQSNDLVSPTSVVEFVANVTGDLHPVFDLTTERVDFGDVFRTSVAQRAITVQNHGRADLTLQSVTISGGRFTHNFTEAIVIPAGQSKDIVVTLPTVQEGSVDDMMTIVTSIGERNVALTGRVIGVPTADLSYTSLNVQIPSGESLAAPLTITNNGNEALIYSVVPGAHVTFNPAYEPGSVTSYTYRSSADYPETKRQWIDIETNGLGTQYNYTYFLGHDFVAVDLPFEFPYFDHKYNRMYVYNSGFVSFTERNDDAIWPEPPGDFPAGTVYTNLIAPYWGLHSMDVTATAGVYHYVTDDEAVVSYIEYGNALNIGIDFQLVIRRDGSFTFNYKAAFPQAVLYAVIGVAGISNVDGTDGINLPARYVQLDTSIDFVPVVQSSLQPGESRVADITVNADALAGKYEGNVAISTNVPTAPIVDIPVKIDITGEPIAVFPDNIVAEQVAGYRDYNYNDQLIAMYGVMWYVPFEVRNDGTAAFTITSIDFESPQYDGRDQFTLLRYGRYIDDWFHQETTGWTSYKGESLTVGTEPVRMAIPFSPSDNSMLAWQTPGTYDLKVTMHISGVPGVTTHTMTIRYIITEQPTMELSRDAIVVSNVPDDYVGVEPLVISNANGKYALRYTLRVDATGEGEALPGDEAYDAAPRHRVMASAKPALAPAEDMSIAAEAIREVAPSIKPNDVGDSQYYYDVPYDMGFQYLRAIYWPALESRPTNYVYGTGTTYGYFRAATAYVAPEGGFNISHIYTAYHPHGLQGKDIIVEIYAGEPATSDDVIGHGSMTIESVTTPLYTPVRSVIALDRPVFVSEGQQFWVVVSYPIGQEYPVALVHKQDAVESNRYLAYWDTFGWFDVASLFKDNYGSLGYIMTCLETRPGDAWIKVLDSNGQAVNVIEGEIAAGASAEIGVRVSAADAPREAGNNAMLVIHSNDPKCSLVNVPLTLSKNGSPVVEVPAATLSVDENTTAAASVIVTDPDGDDMTISLVDNGSHTRIESIKAIGESSTATLTIADDGLSAVAAGVPAGVKLTLTIDAPFGSAGSYALTVYASDASAHEGMGTMAYVVNHVNRAPQPVPYQGMEVVVGSTSDVLALATLFADPDGDNDIVYDIEVADKAVARVYRSADEVIFAGLKLGTTTVKVTATDPSGAVGVNTFGLTVKESAGIDSTWASTQITVGPNPVTDLLVVATGDYQGRVDVDIYGIGGACLLAESYQAAVGTEHTIGVGQLAAGTYVVRVATEAGVTARVIVKE